MKTKNNSYIAYFILLLFVCYGCETKNNEDIIEIQYANMKLDTLSVKDFVDDVEIVPLETKAECLINRVGKLIATQKGFLIINYGAKDGIFMFAEDESFVKQIGRMGHGKGEYTFVLDACANKTSDTIVVSTPDGVSMYDYAGNFRLKKNVIENAYVKQVAMTPAGLLCATHFSGSEYQLHLCDKNLNIIQSMIPTNNTIIALPYASGNSIRGWGNRICYLDYYHSVLYMFDLSDIDNTMKTYKFIGQDIRNYEKNNAEDEDFVELNNFLIDGDCISGSVIDKNGDKVYCRIDTKSNETVKYVYDDWMPEIYFVDDNYYYTILPQNIFLDIVHKQMFNFTYIQDLILKKYNSNLDINEMSNHVILKLKKHESH